MTSYKSISLIICILLACAGSAYATEPPESGPVATSFGNTITLAIEPVWHAKQYVDADGAWRQEADTGEKISGTWKLKGDQICMVQTQPPGPTHCHAAVPRKIGDSWSNIDRETGATVVIGLVAGRE